MALVYRGREAAVRRARQPRGAPRRAPPGQRHLLPAGTGGHRAAARGGGRRAQAGQAGAAGAPGRPRCTALPRTGPVEPSPAAPPWVEPRPGTTQGRQRAVPGRGDSGGRSRPRLAPRKAPPGPPRPSGQRGAGAGEHRALTIELPAADAVQVAGGQSVKRKQQENHICLTFPL